MNQDFARTLSLLRRERKISQRAASEALGISQALLSHYENGIREPGLAFVIRACDYYHVSADYLLGRTLDRDGIVVQTPANTGRTDRARERRQAASASKPIISALVVLFDLLSRTENAVLLQSAGRYLSTAIFDLYRRLRLAAGIRETRPLPSLSDEAFEAGLTEAELTLCRSRYSMELQAHARLGKVFPELSDEALVEEYPSSYTAFLKLTEESGRRVAGHVPEDSLMIRRRRRGE